MAKHEKTRCIIWSSILIGLSINIVNNSPLPFQQQQTSVQCDTRSSCGANQTCCRMPSGQWGCCPFPKAVCCSDGQSCCPNGFTCDLSAGKCIHDYQQLVIDMLLKQKANYNSFDAREQFSFLISDVRCNATQFCEQQQTCCKKTNGDWGCCNHPKAVCCSDNWCCPHGYVCDLRHNQCKKSQDIEITSLSLSADTKELGDDQSQQSVSLTVSFQLTVAVDERSVQCDQQWYCSDRQTCCKLASGQWGCCPLPQAVCCSDHSTCCPSGYLCVPGGKCVHAESRFLPDASYWNVVPSVESAPAMYRPVSAAEDGNKEAQDTRMIATSGVADDVVCPDMRRCSPNLSCCRLSSGLYSCCSYQDVLIRPVSPVEDGNREAQDTRMIATTGVADDVVCPDLSRCSSKSSCCQLSSGLYACCPYHDGVCCETHCCPAGTSCDLENNGCVKHSSCASLTL